MWKNTKEAHTKMPIEMKNGISDHPSSSGIHPVIGAPTLSLVSLRDVIAEQTTKTTTINAKNAVIATMPR